MPKDTLLNELERQEKYLAELPPDFTFPLFNTKRALDSQRQNGYRNTAVAAREIVDNALEAKATKVHVIFETTVNSTRPVVSSVAFIDDGAGMLPSMARFALSWGGARISTNRTSLANSALASRTHRLTRPGRSKSIPARRKISPSRRRG